MHSFRSAIREFHVLHRLPGRDTIMQAVSRRRRLLILSAFLGGVVLLGANWVGVRFSNRELPPSWGAAVRFAVVSLVPLAAVPMRTFALPRGRSSRRGRVRHRPVLPHVRARVLGARRGARGMTSVIGALVGTARATPKPAVTAAD